MEFSIEIEKPSSVSRKFTICIPAHEVQAQFEHQALEIQKVAKHPGFRPGRVPMTLVRKYHLQNIRTQTLDSLVNGSLTEALVKEKLQTVGDIQVAPVSHQHCDHDHDHSHSLMSALFEGQEFRFVAEVEVVPEIHLPEYKGIVLNSLPVEPTEADVNTVLSDLQNRFSIMSPLSAPRPAALKDHLEISIEGKVKTENGWEAHPELSSKYVQLELGAPHAVSGIPGFEEALLGMSSAETKTFQLSFPQDFSVVMWAGKEVEFTVVLNEIKEKQLPVLDQAFAERLGFSNLDELIQRIRMGIQEDKSRAARRQLEIDVVDDLIKRTPSFELPSSWVRMQTGLLLKDMEDMAQARKSAARTSEELEKARVEAQKIAEHQLRTFVVLGEIAVQEKLSVSADDVQTEIRERLNSAPVEQAAKLAAHYGQSDGRRTLTRQLERAKTLDFLLAHSKMTLPVHVANGDAS